MKPLALIAATLGALAMFAGSPYPSPKADVEQLASEVTREADHVTALELASWIKDRKPGLRVIDVRPLADYGEYHIPRAEHITLQSLSTMRFADDETVVLYSDGGAHAAQGWVFLRTLGNQHVYFLRGGLNEWLGDVMRPEKGSDVSRYFGGVPRGIDEKRDVSPAAVRRLGC